MHVVLGLLVVLRREILQTCVEQVARAVAVDGGDGDRVAETEVIELVELGIGGAGGVHLVHGEHDRLFRPLQHVRDLLIGGGHAGLDVDDEDDDRRVVDGDLRLLAHERRESGLSVLGSMPPVSTRVKVRPFQSALAVDAVARHAGRVLHDGKAAADELVKEHGLAHVGAAHDGDDGFRHKKSLLYSVAGGEHGVRQVKAVHADHLHRASRAPRKERGTV